MRFRLFALMVVCVIVAAALPGASAQTDAPLQNGGHYLIFLPNDGETPRLTLTAETGQNVVVTLVTSAGVRLDPQVLDTSGQPVDFRLDPLPDRTIISFQATDSAYSLLLESEPGSMAGYARLTYGLTPTLFSTTPSLFTGDTLTPAFDEPFDNTARPWWQGQSLNGSIALAEGGLLMDVQRGGPLFTGFTRVPGTDSPGYYLSATVTLSESTGTALFGLIPRMIDGVNFNVWQISPETGTWRFVWLNEGTWIPILDWQSDERLLNATGTHTLGVWVIDDLYIFVWDGQPIGHVRDAALLLGGAGLYSESIDGTAFTLLWDDFYVGTAEAGSAWPTPLLPPAGVASGEQGITITALGMDNELAQGLIAEWYWTDESRTQGVTLAFAPDGGFTRTIASLETDGNSFEETGTWRIVPGGTLVLDIPLRGQERYNIRLESANTALVMGSDFEERTYVRLASE